MFAKKGPSVDELQSRIEKLEAELQDSDAKLASSYEDNAQLEEDLRVAREDVDRISSTNERIRGHLETGDYIMDGERFPTKDLVRVLREELACVHAELKGLKDAVNASHTLLKPHLGE